MSSTANAPTAVGTRTPMLSLLSALLLVTSMVIGSVASAGELLDVELHPDDLGVVTLGVRDSVELTPILSVDGLQTEVTLADRSPSTRWQPLFLFVDTVHITADRLDKIKSTVSQLAARELGAGTSLVAVTDQLGAGVEAAVPEDVDRAIGSMMLGLSVTPNPDPRGRLPQHSTLAPYMAQRLANVPVPKARPWALVFSSLCVSPEDVPQESLKGFKGPIRFLTWSEGLSADCLASRQRWLEQLRQIRGDIEVFDLDDPEQSAGAQKAQAGRTDLVDETIRFSGVPYKGGVLTLGVQLEGSDDWSTAYSEEKLFSLAPGWPYQATLNRQKRTKMGALIGFGVMLVLLIGLTLLKARSRGLEIAKWEAVGEAEDLAVQLDSDAWNATIFQLTGAMPALKDVREAAQLGPGTESVTVQAESMAEGQLDPDGTVDSPPLTGPGATETTLVKPPEGDEAPKEGTGLTVPMDVLDDGTGYEAEKPFEIGVLHEGKPVARKTKKFRKVFSIGRATDNRVVVQKDDTVHRYHVVIRPAVEGKEWWLEVSPTASNRTNLNGKELRAGSRYRLPSKFRLRIGEMTEVRGRLSS